jgi:ribose/xylose/arabinose/galactoside ABC-type transport system permease subunit
LLTGGVGTMAGPLAGVLLLGVIDNVINQVGTLSPYYQNLASGAFLLAAVIVQTVLTGRRHGAARASGGGRKGSAPRGAART